MVVFQVEAKRAEQQQPRGAGQSTNMGMGGAQMNAGYGRAGHYGYTQQPGQNIAVGTWYTKGTEPSGHNREVPVL